MIDRADRTESSRLATRRVLVTGASGYLGSHLCDRLIATGAEVHGVSRSDRASGGGIHWWRGDLEEALTVDGLLQAVRPEIVYHLGGRVPSDPGVGEVLPTLASLLASSVRLLVRATELGAFRVVLCASYTEPVQPSAIAASPYAMAKWCATAYARMFHELYDTPVVVARPFMTYGPREQSYKLVPYVLRSLLQCRAPRLTSGSLRADWVYVDDVIDGLLRIATAGGIEGKEIDLGTGVLTSVRDVVGRIADLVQAEVEPEFGALPDRLGEQVRAADVENGERLLGWRARTSLVEGLERSIAWHRQRLRMDGGGGD